MSHRERQRDNLPWSGFLFSTRGMKSEASAGFKREKFSGDFAQAGHLRTGKIIVRKKIFRRNLTQSSSWHTFHG